MWRGFPGLGACLLAACTPASGTEGGTGTGTETTEGPEPTSGLGTTAGSSSGFGPTTTFGMDGPLDDGSEVGFVGPLDVACASASSASPHCALCSVREQSCLDDFKCVAWAEDGGDAWTGTKCIGTPLAAVGVGEPCTVVDGVASGRDDCAKGSMCWAADPSTLEGTCVPFCSPDERAPCPDGLGCMIDGLEVLAVCLPPCSPLDPRACGPDHTCRYFPASQGAFCLPDQGGVVLSPTIQCGVQDQACPADRVCVTAATYGGCNAPTCCTPWCDLDDPTADRQCAAIEPDHQCIPLFDEGPAPAGLPNLGLCAVPPR